MNVYQYKATAFLSSNYNLPIGRIEPTDTNLRYVGVADSHGTCPGG